MCLFFQHCTYKSVQVAHDINQESGFRQSACVHVCVHVHARVNTVLCTHSDHSLWESLSGLQQKNIWNEKVVVLSKKKNNNINFHRTKTNTHIITLLHTSSIPMASSSSFMTSIKSTYTISFTLLPSPPPLLPPLK